MPPHIRGVPICFCSLPRAYAAGLLYAAHIRGLKIRLAHGERGNINIIITLRGVKSTPVALVKLRGAQLNQARGGLD